MLELTLFACLLFLTAASITVGSSGPSTDDNRYLPVEGGWRIRIDKDEADASVSAPAIGVVQDDPRLHGRALFPPADRSMVWDEDDLTRIERYPFRPLIIAYNEPRFIFDFHSAGGLLGHMHIGLMLKSGKSRWFHQFSEISVSYTYGRMEYILRDGQFPDVVVSLTATALAGSAGLGVKVKVDGLTEDASLVWGYGGASAFFHNWSTTGAEFTFSPEQCQKDIIRWDDRSFSLVRAFDESDPCMSQIFTAALYLPDWKAEITGGGSGDVRTGSGDPGEFASSPASLIATADWAATGEKQNCVAVQEIPLEGDADGIFIVVGMGGNISEAVGDPRKAFDAALARNREIAGRVVTHTPDPYLDAAMPMMAFATEGIWGDCSIIHGAWSWRFAYLGWRGWYGPDCYGWTERIRKCILEHTRLNLVREGPDEGALGALMEYEPGVYYNMNEVFLDHVRHYFDYTGDLELMREIFPVLRGIVEWESRRLQPEDGYLYENALNTWISDSHWYIGGQCTQASAYMLQANELLADLAGRLGEDESPYRERAKGIRAAMQEKLWMPRSGLFAEYLDTRGSRMLHIEPELATIYHSAEFGAADSMQIYQMLHWADRHLESVMTPNGGKLYWSSNWYPNNGRSYTHSTYEMAYAEELNFSLTNYLVGRGDEGYMLIKSALCGIFNGPNPGSLSGHAFTDGRSRANPDFADTISMWGRTLCEGLFGILPRLPDGIVELIPQFTEEWPEASIETPHFSYRWKHGAGGQEIEWESPHKVSVHLRLPVCAEEIGRVIVDGKDAEFRLSPGIGFTWIEIDTPPEKSGHIRVSYTAGSIRIPGEITVKQGDRFRMSIPDVDITGWSDPQGALSDAGIKDGTLVGDVACEPGPALLFLSVEGRCPSLIPVRLLVEPDAPPSPRKAWSAPEAAKDLQLWRVVDLTGTFNASVTEVLERVADAAKPPSPPASTVGFNYWKDHLIARCLDQPRAPSDLAWRGKVGEDGIAWTADGIPFRTSKAGANIGVVTLAGGYPSRLEFPVGASGKTLYLMLSGMTFPNQSHVVNLRVVLRYADGQEDGFDLVNPFDIGDCWSVWCGRWHDTEVNGFENIGGRFGPAGSSEVNDLTQPINVDTEAHLVPFDLRLGVELRSVEIEVVANDVIFGVMGATILK